MNWVALVIFNINIVEAFPFFKSGVVSEMIKPLGRVAVVFVLGAVGCLPAVAQNMPKVTPETPLQFSPVLNHYCVTCHNETLKTAGLMLDKMDLRNVPAGAPVWEKVVRKLRTASMPPAGMPRPDEATYDSLARYLETELDSAAEAKPNPGRAIIHRLNRAEYANAIRDLFAVDIDSRSLLPADDAGSGFDNIADNLTISPALFERYMSAAEKISRLAVGDPSIAPNPEMYNLPKFLWQDDRMSEDLPFGSRGGIAIRKYFPLNGEYVIKVRLNRRDFGDILGISRPHWLDVRVDGSRIKLFTFGGQGKADPEADSALEVRYPVKAGPHVIAVTFLKDMLMPEGVLKARVDNRNDPPEGVSSVSIIGPYKATGPGETPSRHKIFVCHPAKTTDEDRCATEILSNLARRAYRRPVTKGDVEPLIKLYKGASLNRGFEAGIETAIRGILVSPGFLFRSEHDPTNVAPETVYRISDVQLASRLSFFLWSSIPDDELLGLAAQGKLKNRAVLEKQVRRMLNDARSEALVDNFGGQWLYLRNLRTKLPDPAEFPDFDENLRNAFQRETELFFDSIIREDRSVVDLLNADYTFVNERLAAFYGIPNVYGNQFRRVTLTDENRKGLLGKGSILTVTSYATRTAPTLRGKWLLENILGAPPPPPPPNVPSLKDDEKVQNLTMRQRMEEHRKNAVCASCHARMDPLGFALENFDAIGRWRSTSGAANSPIDASGVLPEGTKFNGPAELRDILLTRREQFVTTLTEKLLIYSLGRDVEYYDAPSVREIIRQAAPDYRWSSLILGIVNSVPFQMRKAQTHGGPPLQLSAKSQSVRPPSAGPH